MKILVLNGPNLNMLGIREPALYGADGYEALVATIRAHCDANGIDVDIHQSNHEGMLIELVQNALGVYDGIVINAAGYSHTSIALMDALKAVSLPAVEVHLTDTRLREPFRHTSYVGMACMATVQGLGFDGYIQAIEMLRSRE